MMISVVYYESNQYIYKEGIVTEIDLTYKKMLKIVDKLIEVIFWLLISCKILINTKRKLHFIKRFPF